MTANVAPAQCAALYDACLIGDFPTARKLQDKLIRLHKALFLDASPSPTKFALSHLGLCAAEVRLPIAPCSEAVKPAIVAAMAEARRGDMTEKLIAENRRARFDYFLDDKVEAGLMLTGTEVKALRLGRANIAESYAAAQGREIVLINANIPEYGPANRFNHEPTRPRKLLLHRKQIDKMLAAIQRDGRTLVPTRLYFNEKGMVKLEVALAKGKKAHDKREVEADRDWKREQGRLMRDRG